MKNILRITLVILLINCLSAGVSARERIKLTVWGSLSVEQSAQLRAQVSEFERRHPGVKVSLLSMGAGNMNPQKLMTAIVGKVPPDVVNQDRFTIGDWASRGAFMDLTPFIRRDRSKPDGVRPEEYYKPCWNEAVYKGGVYAIPNSTDARFLFYNKTLFRKAGLDPNKPPRTWDELREYTRRLTVRDNTGRIVQIGFIPDFGNSWFYLYSWQNEGEFMDPTGRICTLNNPRSVTSLEYCKKLYEDAGGAPVVTRFRSGFQGEAMDPFLTGSVAMKVDCDMAANLIARFNPGMDFGVAPAPVPTERFQRGVLNVEFGQGGWPSGIDQKSYSVRKSRSVSGSVFSGKPAYITWSGGFSWAIPVGSRHTRLAWEYIKWMNSPESNVIGAIAQRKYNLSRGSPYTPAIHANMKVNESVFARCAPEIPRFRKTLKFALSMMPYSRFRPVTFVGQQLWDQHAWAYDKAINYRESHMTPKQAVDEATASVQRDLDAVYSREKYKIVPLWVFYVAIGGSILLMILGIALFIRKSGNIGAARKGEARAGFFFASPWILGFIIFTAGPIIASIVFSFSDYDVLHDARWVGVSNYVGLFTYEWEPFSRALYNTVFLALIGLPLGIITGLSIALLLNTDVKGMAWYRTIYYLPSIVPVVASTLLWTWVLNPEFGIINAVWRLTLTKWFGWGSPGWLSQSGEFFGIAQWFWNHTLGYFGAPTPTFLSHPATYLGAKSALILMGLWGAGGGMIVWLAGLKGIPRHLYEAAEIDGASIWRKFCSVTLPMLSPYIFFNLIMGTIGVIQTFDTVYIVSGGSPSDATIVPVMYLFNKAFRYFNMGYASATAWILFIIIMAFTLAQLKLAPKWVYYESEK